MLGKSKEAKKPKKDKKPKLTPKQKALKNKEKVERAAAAKIKAAEAKVKKAEQAIKNKEKKEENKVKKAAQKEANAVKKLEKKQQKAEAKAEKKALAKIRRREIKDEKKAQKMQKRAQLAARTPLQKKADRQMKLKRTAIVILVVALMTGIATVGVKTAPIVAKKLNIPSFNIAERLPFLKEKKDDKKEEEEKEEEEENGKGKDVDKETPPEAETPEEPDDKTLVIAGNKILHDYYTKALGEFLELDKTALKEQSKVLKNEEAYTGLINGDYQVIFAGEPTDKELRMASLAGKTLNPVPILNGGFVFFVNKENPVKNLTKTQLYNIYTGTITNWKELGGEDREILAFQGTGSSAAQSTIYTHIVSEDEISKVGKELRRENTKEMIDAVKGETGAIGFAYYYYYDLSKSKDDVKMISVNGVEANRKNIETAKYPLTIYSYAVVAMEENTTDLAGVIEMVDSRINEKKNAETAEAGEGGEGETEDKTPLKLKFIKFILSDLGQKMAEKEGFMRHADPLPLD